MTAYGGKVKAELVLDTDKFSAAWKKVLNDLNSTPTPSGPAKIQREVDKMAAGVRKSTSTFQSAIQKMGTIYHSVVQKMQNSTNATVQRIGNQLNALGQRFNPNRIHDKFDSVMRKLPSSAQSVVSKVVSNFDAISSRVNFNRISDKFNATIQKMASTAKSGVSKIASSFSSMESGIEGILGTLTAGLGMSQLFEMGQAKAVTQQMLRNMGKSDFFRGYEAYVLKSATPDADINRMFQWVAQTPGLQAKDVERALSAIDAASYSTDPINRLRDQTAWAKFIQGGWDTAAGAMRDEPIPDFIRRKMQEADTAEERIAVAEEFARLRGTMDAFGMNLSTTTEGAVGDFNAALVAVDNLTRALRDAFIDLLHALRPAIDWFNSLGEPLQGLIGKFILAGTVLTGAIGGLKLFASALSPVTSILKGLGGGAADLIPGVKSGGKSGRVPFFATAPGQFLKGLSGIPALTGTGGATWAGMTGATAAGTVAFAGILGALYGHLMNLADTSQKNNPIWGATRMLTLPTFVGGAPLQTAMGFWGDIFSGRAFKDPLGTLKDVGQGVFLPKTLRENVLIKPAFDALDSAVGTVTSAFKGAWNSINTFFGGVWKNLISTVGPVSSAFRDAWNSINTFFGGVWKNLISTVGTVSSAFRDAWNSINTFFGGVWKDLNSAIGIVSGAFRDVWSALSPAVNELSAAFGEVLSALGDVYNELKGAFGDVWNELSGAAREVYSALRSVYNELRGAFGDVWNELSSAAREVYSALHSLWSEAIKPLSDAFSELWTALFPVKEAAEATGDVAPTIQEAKPAFSILIEGAKWLAEIIREATPYIVTFAGYIRTAARYVREFAKFIHEVSEAIRIFRSTLSNFKLPTWDDIVGWIKDKFDQITGKLDLGQWYDDGKQWLKDKFDQVTGKLDLGQWYSDGKKWIKTKIDQIKGKLDLMKWYNDGKKWIKTKIDQIKGKLDLMKWYNDGKKWIKTKIDQIKGKLDLMKWYNDGKKWIKTKIDQIKGKLDLGRWYNDGKKWIKTKIDQLRGSFNISSLASQATNWVRNKINQLRGGFNISSLASKASNWVRSRVSRIFGSFNISALASQAWSWVRSRLSFSGAMSSVTSALSRAYSTVRSWLPFGPGPKSPSNQNSFIDRASGAGDGASAFLDNMFSNFRYEEYEGSQKSIAQTLEDMSGNCVDGSLAQVWMAGQLGIPMGLEFTTWNGSPHVLAVDDMGRPRDVANHAITGSWDRPPAGPGDGGRGGVFIAKGAVQINGDINGIKDAEKTMEKVFIRMANKYLV